MTENLLADRVRTVLAGPGITEKQMFGGICFLLNGNMLAGASRRGLLLRLDAADYGAALDRPHTRPMERNGRPMAGYLYVADEGTADTKSLRGWLDLARKHVATLPAKPAKAPARSAKKQSPR